MSGTIIDFGEKSNPGVSFLDKVKPFYPLLLILAIASIFFALGRLSALEKAHTPIKIEYPSLATSTGQTATVFNSISPPHTESETVVGSKSGKKYYYPWCGTVKRIKPENQVHFASIDAAKTAGFTPGGNCKGLK
jgi:hypothetical protein